jgi:hypothetical protein
MSEMQINNSAAPQINLESTTDQKPMLSRKEESKRRQEEFYKELEKVNSPIEEEIKTAFEGDNPHVEDGDSFDNTQDNTQLDEDDTQLDEKTIPRKRLNKEIEARKALEEELRKERDSRIKYETELGLYTQALASLQTDKEQTEQNFDIDPVDTEAHNLYMKEINALKKQVQNQTTHTTEFEQRQQFENTVNAQAAQFARSNPDFNDAYSFLLGIEANKAKVLGYSDAQAQQFALSQIQPIAQEVYKKGGNVAEMAYTLAKNYGYKPTTTKKVINSPDLDKVSKNMAKSHTMLDEIPGVSTSIAPEHAAYNTLEGFKAKLAGKFGRGTDVAAFQNALRKLQNNG